MSEHVVLRPLSFFWVAALAFKRYLSVFHSAREIQVGSISDFFFFGTVQIVNYYTCDDNANSPSFSKKSPLLLFT